MDASMMRRLKELEDENRPLKRIYADLSIQTEIVKDALQKSGEAISKHKCQFLTQQSRFCCRQGHLAQGGSNDTSCLK